jgi:hypothetical protein
VAYRFVKNDLCATIAQFPASKLIKGDMSKKMLFLRIKTIEKITAGLIVLNLAVFVKLCLDYYFKF